MPQNFLERLGLNIPDGGRLAIPEVPEGIRNFGRGLISPEESAMKPEGERLGWQEALGGVLGAGMLPLTGSAKLANKLGRQGVRHSLGKNSSSPQGLREYMQELEELRQNAIAQSYNQRGIGRGLDQEAYRQEWLRPRLRDIDKSVMDAVKHPEIWQPGQSSRLSSPLDKQEPLRSPQRLR